MSQSSENEASIVFIDLAGFSALTDVYGDERALVMLQVFEDIVHDALGDAVPLKWIGDEVMLALRSQAGAMGDARLSGCVPHPSGGSSKWRSCPWSTHCSTAIGLQLATTDEPGAKGAFPYEISHVGARIDSGCRRRVRWGSFS